MENGMKGDEFVRAWDIGGSIIYVPYMSLIVTSAKLENLKNPINNLERGEKEISSFSITRFPPSIDK